MPNTLSINYYGYFSPFSGYGVANINWVKHLTRRGVDVSIQASQRPQEGSNEWLSLTEEERRIFEKPFEKRKVGIVETNPFSFHLNESEVKIANTMCESDRLGEKWVQACNGMNHIIVPTKFQKRVFKYSGVTVPITVIPHGTETEKFPYYKRPEREVFTFGTLGWMEAGGKEKDRKGVWSTIEAFISEFEPDEPVRLLIKSSNGSFAYYSDWKDYDIEVVTDLVPHDQLKDFYNQMDCFVFPSKAEGVGYPPREAMATGLPVILTNYSSLEDIALPEISYPLDPVSFENRTDMLEQPGRWANIDVRELMYYMRWVYNNRKIALDKGKIAADWIRKNESWDAATDQMIKFLHAEILT